MLFPFKLIGKQRVPPNPYKARFTFHHSSFYSEIRERNGRRVQENNDPPTLQHTPVGRIGNGEDMGRHFMALLALVQIDDLLGVNRQLLVRVDNDAKQAGVSLHGHNKHIKTVPHHCQHYNTPTETLALSITFNDSKNLI